jgi:hypothetical protein
VKRRLIAAALVVMAAAAVSAEDLTDALRDLLANALEVKISARLVPPEVDKPAWNVESKKLTIPGRSVNVRLDGDNVVILLECTPYMTENGEVLLQANGQVWFTEPPEKKARYYSTTYSIPVGFGEKVLFFPMGVPQPQGSKNYVNIELQIVIVPYQQDAEAATKDKP